jgi:general secretion pathway protein K
MRHAERGVAVVMAMGVVSLAAVLATAILASQTAWSRRAELTAQYAQALELLQTGGDWARAVLSDDRRSNSVDHLGEPWAMRLPPMPVENGELVGHIEDQQGAFNLNNMVSDGKVSPAQFERFQRLLSILGLPAPLADALVDWIDEDDLPQPGHGAEDEYYLSLDPPYRPANRPLIDIDELALVRGFDSGVRARLAPFVSALPGTTAVNVNTAFPEVLAAVVGGLQLDTARLVVARRNTTYYRANADFLAQLPKEATVPAQDIRVSSDFFLATLRVSSGSAQVRGQALLARLEPGRWPTVVWRKIQ